MGKDYKDNTRGYQNKNTKDTFAEKKERKETIFDFSGYVDKKIIINFSGGREILGILKGYDQVANLVMDNVFEIIREKSRRELGLIIVRGPNVF